ncbi:hypothetical protein GCM10007981_05110 [Thermocladium modestius]|uniref:AAA+ ATPase domain-containing protein n=1 Tax=Thermocladium modestius TaxID=62609 RepID=A0A830GSN5_9CREN|nr:AAA family ATPase [Thermocladium modestius]GGP19833.1 hypothetical protein GCM10007981_05110 [Thermocladium modestius]
MQRSLVTGRHNKVRLLGSSWIKARDSIVQHVRDGNQLITVIGRAGSGKTTLLLSLCDYVQCLYTDMAGAGDRDLSAVTASIAMDNMDKIVELQGELRREKGDLRAFSRLGAYDLMELARSKPLTFLRMLNEAASRRGWRVVMEVDEGLLSQDDPRAFRFIEAMHGFRNNMRLLDSIYLVVTMLPDVVDLIAKVDMPLFEVMRLATVMLPDYVGPDDLQEVASALSLTPEMIEKISRLGPLTMRQLMCVALNPSDVSKCGIDEIVMNPMEEAEVEVQQQ